ncbi:winged helix-turn-helix domain-containing protein [Lentzea alba]|uniref:AfsR/SARP family transcriptional regulator n=1 Tax=Lentzea alba TaxID=2714351 RepID=UPI0039BFCCB2
MIVEYRVLGPLEVLLDGEPVAVPAGRVRILLATLLLRANEFVPVDELVERVWDGEPPVADRGRKTLHMVVTRLRQSLGDANCVRTSSRGYTAEVAPEQLDLTRFRQLEEQGEHRAALELWRGPVLANVASELLHRDDVPRLEAERVVALERRIDQDLARDTDVLVPELRSLVARYPLRETFWAQLMLALHRSNQQAEALAVYQEIRDHLADELGVDPGPRLREAHEQVLSGEVPVAQVPRQLPAGVPHFVGREEELARLTDMLAARPGEPVLISAINGIGGVGKTALALRWAHRVADRFPDGQLHVDLRGFDPRGEPLDPLTVIRDFLLALDVRDVPSSEDALIAAYRSALAQRRVLLVLDNARDAEQVRPLLPGGAGNLVLITSRNRLRGLIAREGAQPVALDVLDEQSAVDLLTERVGAARIAARPEAVSRLVRQCAGLPLALGIVAARAACGDSLTALADELDQERLDALDLDDATGVRAVFSWSLKSVSEAAARVFVLLGLHPGPHVGVDAVASLSELTPAAARRVLGELVSASLLGPAPVPGRFVLHDLLRDYAAERVAALSAGERTEALHRMFGHYLHTALDANRRIEVRVTWTPLAAPPSSVVITPIEDEQSASEWFDVEQNVLLGVLKQMVAAGMDDLVWRLGYTLHLPLLRKGDMAGAEMADQLALAAAQRRDDVFGQARLHRALGGVYIAKHALSDADFHLSSALRCETEQSDYNGQANVSRGLAFVYRLQGRYGDALEILGGVFPMAERLSKHERACYYAAYGRAHHEVGQDERAIELCLQADEWLLELGRTAPAMADAMNFETLGDIYLKLGRYAESAHNYRESVVLMREMRETFYLADGLVLLAKALIAAGEHAPAREHLGEALSIYEELGHDQAREVRKLLGSLE